MALLAPTLLSLAPTADAQAASDPWWGPSSRDRPTDGWAIRVPITIENTFDYALSRPLVWVDLDFGALLAEAGWSRDPNSAEPRLLDFTLDVDSIRVVPYGRGFSPGPRDGSGTQPLPHTFYPSAFNAARFQEFNASRNPAGTVLFRMDTTLNAGEKAFFYVYANPLEFGKKQPATWPAEQRAPLDAFLWGTTGTTFYGYEPQQQNRDHRVAVTALTSATTTVTVYELNFGKYVPVRSTPATPNPLVLNGGSPMSGTLLISTGKAFKLVSDRPIAVQGHGDLDDTTGTTPAAATWFPSTTGSYRGTTFPVYAPGNGNTQMALTAYKVGSGTVTINSGLMVVQLTNANPIATINVPTGRWSFVTATGGAAEFMLSTPFPMGSQLPAPPVQVPSTTGGPSGTNFYASVPRDGGYLRVCAEARTGVRVVDVARPDLQAFPEGTRDTTPPALISPSIGCEMLRATPTTPTTTLEAYAIGPEARYPVENAPVPFRLVQGSAQRDRPEMERPYAGHWGGMGGTDFYVTGRTGVLAYFDNTRITIHQELKSGGSVTLNPIALNADGFHQIENPADNTKTGRYRIVTSKPVSVVSTDDHPWAYFRTVPGLPPNPSIVVGAAEFRGPLLSLRSVDQPYRSTGPSTPITFNLEALNLGRWTGGENLVDTIRLSCTGPTEWDIQGCDRELRIGSGDAERFGITITPTDGVVNTTGYVHVEAFSATPGISAKLRLGVYVEIRYGVGLWFDVENGRKTIDPILGVDPGERHTYSIVIKNTGSTDDTFRLTVDEPKEGWTQRLLLDGEPVRDLRLRAGESRTLRFEVRAPDQETAPQNLVSITAASLSSDLATARDIVNTATRIRPNVNIRLDLDPTTRVAEPNETARFNLTVTNRGNDIFRIMFAQDSILPPGWNATLGITEIDLPPATNHTLTLDVTPPLGARAGDLATVKIAALTDTGGGGGLVASDEISAVVVVKRIHNVTTPPLLDARADPGTTVAYVLPLENKGNGDDIVELLPPPADAWRVRAAEQSILLAHNASADLHIQVDVPAGAPPGTHNVSVTLRLSREATQTIVVPVDVRAVARAQIRGLEALDLAPGRAATIPLTLANTGNLPGRFELAAELPAGWNATFAPAALELLPGDARPVSLRLNASAETEDGDHDVTLTAAVGSERVGEKPLAVRVARPDLKIAAIETSGELAPGELVIVAATIANEGDIVAEDVRVALVVDGVSVDQVTLARIRPGESQVATLNWLATSRGANVQVVIDPDNQIVMPSTTEKVATVNFGSPLFGIPAPGAAFLLAALVLGAALLARRRNA